MVSDMGELSIWQVFLEDFLLSVRIVHTAHTNTFSCTKTQILKIWELDESASTRYNLVLCTLFERHENPFIDNRDALFFFIFVS